MVGCSSEEVTHEVQDFFTNADGRATGYFTEPQSNSQDFLIQNYDVKDVIPDEKEELPAFDTTGPEFGGITEIVSNPDAQKADSTQSKVTVYLSTYHSRQNVNGTANKQSWVCKNPESYTLTWKAIKDLEYTQTAGFHEPANANDMNDVLTQAYAKCYQGASDGVITQNMLDDFESTIGRNANEGLRKKKYVALGYQYQKEAYSIETAILSKASELLVSDQCNVVVTPSSGDTSASFATKSSAAFESSAKLHIVVWARANTEKEDKGWFVIYKNNEKLAKRLAKNLKGVKVKKALKKGYTSTKEHFGDTNYYTILNYSETVPTVILVVGSYKDSKILGLLQNSSVRTDYAEAIAATIKAYLGLEE